MNEVEKKIKEISEKWKSKMQEQGVNRFTYNFYKQNQVELYKDLEEFWHLYKLEELKQTQDLNSNRSVNYETI